MSEIIQPVEIALLINNSALPEAEAVLGRFAEHYAESLVRERDLAERKDLEAPGLFGHEDATEDVADFASLAAQARGEDAAPLSVPDAPWASVEASSDAEAPALSLEPEGLEDAAWAEPSTGGGFDPDTLGDAEPAEPSGDLDDPGDFFASLDEEPAAAAPAKRSDAGMFDDSFGSEPAHSPAASDDGWPDAPAADAAWGDEPEEDLAAGPELGDAEEPAEEEEAEAVAEEASPFADPAAPTPSKKRKKRRS